MQSQSTWQVQEAKNRFSEMIERAQNEGPQVITRHGRAVARVVATNVGNSGQEVSLDGQLTKDGFADYLLAMPKCDALQPPVRRSRKAAPVLGG